MKRRLTIFSVIFVLLLSSSCGGLEGKRFDTLTKEINQNYSIQVNAYQTNCLFICDANYVIESINNKNGYPNKILYEFQNDDPYNIPAENFVVKNENLHISGGDTYSA